MRKNFIALDLNKSLYPYILQKNLHKNHCIKIKGCCFPFTTKTVTTATIFDSGLNIS
jgi:hypothetical protein